MGLAISSSTAVTLRGIASGFSALGLLLTVLRLMYRIWLRRFWLEDVWATVALLCGISTLTTTWTYMRGEDSEVVLSFWIYAVCFPSTVWAVRQSILFSIARIFFETQRLRRLLLGLAILFFCMWAGFIAQKAWKYGHSGLHHSEGAVYAFMIPPTVLYELSIDCLSDTILTVLPLRLLWSLKLPKRQKRMILVIFASSIIVTAVSIFRAICQIQRYITVTSTATDFEMAASLIVCNLLVVVTLLYRLFGFVDADDNASSSDDDYTTQATPQATPQLTTRVFTSIDLDDSGTGGDERTKGDTKPDEKQRSDSLSFQIDS